MEENAIDEIVNETIENIEDAPFGITEEEFEKIESGDNNDADK